MKSTEAKATASRYAKVAPSLERIEQIDTRLSAIGAEEKRITGALPKEEVADRLVAWLKARRETFEKPSNGSGAYRVSAHDAVSQLSSDKPGVRFGGFAPEQHVLDFLIFLLGPSMEKTAREAVGRLEYRAGAPAAERTKLKASLVREREHLVREREPLVETVRAAGVDCAHLPETQQRIDTEGRQAELQAERRARQEAGLREIDARVN